MTTRDRASKPAPVKLSFVILYVANLKRSLEFYGAAFGLKPKMVHESGFYAELETGSTTLALTQNELARSLHPKGYRENDPAAQPAGIQITLEPENVARAFENARHCGARALSAPEIKPWGWECAFVRDPDGVLIELAKPVEKKAND